MSNFIFTFVVLIFCLVMAIFCFSTGREVLGAINSISVIVNIVALYLQLRS